VILSSLIWINYIKYKKKKFHLFYILGISLFTLFTNLSSFVNISYPEQVNFNCLLIPCLYFSLYLDKEKNIQFILKYIFFAAALVAFLIIFQHLIQDYSYFVASTLRVKATYYYHSSASLFLALSLFIILHYKKLEQFKLIDWGILVLIVSALFFNSTRAINLSLSVAMIYILIRHIILKNYITCLFPLIIIITFSGSIVYNKENIPPIKVSTKVAEAPPKVIDSSPKVIDSSPKVIDSSPKVTMQGALSLPSYLENSTSDNHYGQTKIKSYLENNRLRLKILENLKVSSVNPFLGIGIGKPISARHACNKKYSFSSHSLIIDILILTGGFSFISFILIFLIPIFYKKDNAKMGEYKITYIGSILFIFCVSFFFPKEQNYLMILFLLMPILYISMAESEYQFEENEHKGASLDIFKTFAITSSLAYIFLFSPRYILPAIEFHYADFVGNKSKYNYPLFTNSLSLKYSLETSFKLLKGKNVEVHLLDDDYKKFPLENAWVFWDPLKEGNYPILLSTIGQTAYSEYGFWDTLARLKNWKSIRLYLTGITLFKISRKDVDRE
jgi:hypothetical protein